jgi:hypothetical protein
MKRGKYKEGVGDAFHQFITTYSKRDNFELLNGCLNGSVYSGVVWHTSALFREAGSRWN